MLMRHARAHSSSCLQEILVYLHSFHRNSLLCNQKLPKKSPKTPIFGVQGQSKSSILTILRSSSLVLVLLSSMSVPICNHFDVRQASSGQIITFKMGTLFWYPHAHVFLNLEGPDLNCWNLHSMLKILCAGCLGLSPAILAQFTLEMRVAARNREKNY